MEGALLLRTYNKVNNIVEISIGKAPYIYVATRGCLFLWRIFKLNQQRQLPTHKYTISYGLICYLKGK